jgi:CRP/FNR family transcriptional regulator, anaerobic regulatory protein
MNEKIFKHLKEKHKEVAALTHKFILELEKMPDVVIKEFPKHSFLVSKNIFNPNIYFIKKGYVRAFTHDAKMNEISFWFAFENQAIFSTSCHILQVPSSVMIQAMEDTEVIVVTKPKLDFMYEHDVSVLRMGKAIMELYIVQLSLRTLSLQATFAEFRYHELLEQFPFILQRVPLRHIASYIGVKEETLSRIRANYKTK